MQELSLINVHKIIPFVFALSIVAEPVLAWGSGSSDCPFMKNGANREDSTEELEQKQPSEGN